MTLLRRPVVVLPGCFAIRSVEGGVLGEKWLVISNLPSHNRDEPLRLTIETSAQVDVRRQEARESSAMDCDGVVGVVRLLGGPYLAVITSSTLVGPGPGVASFHRVDRVELLPFMDATHAPSTLSKFEQRDETEFLQMIHQTFASRAFYFANSYDITQSVQRISDIPPTAGEPGNWTRADSRFLWNSQFLDDFARMNEELPECSSYVTPIMNGFVSCYRDAAGPGGGPSFDMLLISRRSRHRQGTRFYRRGIDTAGDVANFVETEQLLLHSDGRVSSFVQVRGSIPVFWSQEPTLKYTPKCTINPRYTEEQTTVACSTHMRALNEVYSGPVYAVNLIDKKGDQDRLGKAYQTATVKSANAGARIKFIWFDFHKECRKMRYDRLSLLMDELLPGLREMGYFQTASNGSVATRQAGVVRTNCMDNLDRTNVVQSLFARWAALESLQGVPPSKNVLDSGLPGFERSFKNMWADNADALSKLYSGTGALKTDFTRTGQRTKLGALQDGVNSVTRYVLNNLSDGRTQDRWDLFLGRYVPRLAGGGAGYDVSKSPLRAMKKDFTPTSFFVGLVLVGLAFVGGSVAVHTVTGSTRPFMSQVMIGTWLGSIVFGVAAFLQMGRGIGPGQHIVPKPRFTKAGDVDRDSSL